ncbi:hypothetical protein PV05_08188 [Exophiala xenobiotica]|uniref:BZIP domain-containing protein n=1 Tax=Exophiala xenobiotica TaxID=348802 RepID=A0A0D2EB62_9EURO|nr:uncharacterized protein PV05_08188 [Exophiala xenobiotica]KIW52558.1 hypothetical protein PV05_08188 [Exophiala xenobiotica]
MSSKASSSGDTASPPTKTPPHTLIRVRNNQRRHRERRRQYIALLEQKLQDSERHLDQALAELAILKSKLAQCQPNSHESGRPCPVTQPTSLRSVLEADQQYDLNDNQQAVTIDNAPNDSGAHSCSTIDEIADVSPPGLGTMMPRPSIPEPLLSSLSCSHYPPSDGQPTTACVQAYIVISNLNYRGLDSESITAWLNPGFRRSGLRDEGCQVESKLLFELLDFISDP